MNLKLSILVVMLALFGFMHLDTSLFAEESGKAAESHEEHHPDKKTAEKSSDQKKTNEDAAMMGGMDMGAMMGMMHTCMEMHKDGKMCDHEAMQKCQEKSKMGDCQKMMKQAKAKANTKK